MAFTSTTELYAVQPRTSLRRRYDELEKPVTRWLARNSLTLLRISMGIVYVWFGALKFFPGVSPIEGFIRETMPFLPLDLFIPFLAAWEVAIGIGFMTGKFPRLTLALMLGQMAGAMSPIILRPDLIFANFPAYTLVGQYIVKDIILVSAALVLGATVRGGGLTSEPKTRS